MCVQQARYLPVRLIFTVLCVVAANYPSYGCITLHYLIVHDTVLF